nr:DUF4440 domain-containing protein [uncultured Sphingomonas sp.]
MNRSILLAASMLAVASAGCKKAGPSAAPVTGPEAVQIIAATEADYNRGDPAKIMSHYAEGAVAFDPGHVDPTQDPKVLKDWVDEFVSMKPADYSVSQPAIQLIGADAFVSYGVAHFTVAAGAARPQVSVRFSQVYQRQKDGSWKIIHEHMSMPPNPAAVPAQ